jgi:4-hydroxy-tetrahydrodipicolinate synthase
LTTAASSFAKLPTGVHPVIYALFGADGELDRAAMRRQVDICVEQGAQGLVTLGLATEVRHLTAVQRRQIVEWNAEDLGGRIPLGVTIFAATADEQLADINHARAAGAAWVILQPLPGITTEDELARSFADVLGRTSLPAALQNVPQFLGVGLSVAAIAALADHHPSLIGVKQEVSATETAELVAAVGARLQVFSGRGGLELVDCCRAGIAGHVPAPEYADLLMLIWQAMAAGDERTARDVYARALPIATFVLQSLDSLVCYGKALFCLRHGLPFHPRTGGPVPTRFGLDALAGHAAHAGLALDETALAALRTRRA